MRVERARPSVRPKPQTSRSSSSFVNTRCGSLASFTRSSYSFVGSRTRSPPTVTRLVGRSISISPAASRSDSGGAAAQDGSDPGHELVVVERPVEVVVAAAVERAHPVDGIRLPGLRAGSRGPPPHEARPSRSRRQSSSPSGSPISTRSGRAARRGRAPRRSPRSTTSNPSWIRCRSRKLRVASSGSVSRSALGMDADASAVPRPPPDVHCCECVTKRSTARLSDRQHGAFTPRSDPSRATEDAPQQPQPEHAREEEAERRDDVQPEHLRTARREDADQARADQPGGDDEGDDQAG